MDNRRRPIKHFIIYKEVQVPFILRTLAVVAVSTLLALTVIALAYYLYSKSGYLYFLSSDFEEPLLRKSLLGLALPGLLAAEAVTLAAGFFIALAGSRRMAVPLFKLKRWAEALAEGKLNVNLVFRERMQYKQLMHVCNFGLQNLRQAFAEIDSCLNSQKVLKDDAAREDLQKALADARTALSGFKFESSETETL